MGIPFWLILFTALTASDAPEDEGGRIVLQWDPVPQAVGYLVERARTPEGPFKTVAALDAWVREYTDTGVQDGVPYYYRVQAKLPGDSLRFVGTAGPVIASPQWFRTSRTGILVAILILTGLFWTFVSRARRGEALFIRKIPGLEAIDDAVGRAAELGRPIVYVPGLLGLNNITTIASLGILRRVARKAAEYEVDLIMPNADPVVMATAQETVREAYLDAGRPDLFRPQNIVYLTSDQFGFAAGVDGILVREKPGAVFLQGYFYAESLILAETAHAAGAIQIAGTTATTQLPFFIAASDYTLIGEEMLAASAYLSKDPVMLGSLKAEDWANALILLFLIVALILKTLGIVDLSVLLTSR